ncbi:hypothetical protein FSP39_010924 [Pinctada imbricata]|uniref:MULE transposase domain-containing protein n=1 Tax=Pinctada imbricata TaxID=66713 RepID=A0AA88YLG7_PINIB|nr:hypothetical protein FSP39_010924 [Pinctada imbricata]
MRPVVFAFLPGKSQCIYARFFSLLLNSITKLGLTFSPTNAMQDFETAAHTAIKDVFHGVSTTGCFFHFTQCIWRKAQSTGLQMLYRDNSDVKILVRRAAILPLVPLDAIEDVWFQALEDRDDADISDVTQTFTDYVTDQWVDGDRLQWNHFGTNGPRTTNNLEGWHSKLKKMAQHSHPNIFNSIQMIKDVQNAIEINAMQRDAGGTTRPKSKKYVTIDRRLTTLRQRYQDGIIELMDYADSASELLHLG